MENGIYQTTTKKFLELFKIYFERSSLVLSEKRTYYVKKRTHRYSRADHSKSDDTARVQTIAQPAPEEHCL